MSLRVRTALLPLVAVLLAMALPAAASADGAPAPAPVTLGAAFSLTGAGAPYGPSQQRGAQLAVDRVNAGGGLTAGGPPLALDVRDDRSDPAGATAAFGALIDGGAAALLGPTLSAAALAADRVAQERGVPVLGVSNTIDGLTDIGPFVFRDSLAESAVQPQTVKVAKKRFALKRVAIVSTTDAYSAAGRTVFRAALKKQRIAVAADRTFATGKPASLRAALKAAAASGPDALVISALQGDIVKAMIGARTFKALKSVHFIGGNAFNAPGLYAQTKGAAEGAVSGSAWVAAGKTPGNAAFVAAYTAKYGAAPDQFAAQAYAGVLLVVAAMRQAGVGATPAQLRDALAAIRSTDTILGSFSFDAARDPRYTPAVVVDRKGRQVAIG